MPACFQPPTSRPWTTPGCGSSSAPARSGPQATLRPTSTGVGTPQGHALAVLRSPDRGAERLRGALDGATRLPSDRAGGRRSATSPSGGRPAGRRRRAGHPTAGRALQLRCSARIRARPRRRAPPSRRNLTQGLTSSPTRPPDPLAETETRRGNEPSRYFCSTSTAQASFPRLAPAPLTLVRVVAWGRR